MNESIFGDEENNVVFLGHLHCNGEIIDGLGREEDVDGLLLENWSSFLVVHFHNMEL
jgi:hypothetical protein